MESDALIAKWRVQQVAACERFGAQLTMPDVDQNSGVSKNLVDGRWFNDGIWPLHGARHLPTPTTTGWYIWAGENTMEPDFFVAAHTAHLETWAADAVPYLGLPTGWRFLVGPGHEDVWFDSSLLIQ